MKKSLFALAAIASLGLFAVGCGDGEEGAACVSTLLDCSEGLVCNTYAGECQTPDACAAKKGYFCDPNTQVCNETNGECVAKGSAAEDCRTKGCGDGQTCVVDSEGAYGCLDDDKVCLNGTIWNSTLEKCVADEGDYGECPDGSNESCDEGYVCNQDTLKCVPKTVDNKPRPYKYVKIEDLSPDELKTTKEDPGVDIDAVVLTKKDSGAKIYATSVVFYERGDGESSKPEDKAHAFDSNAILNEPDSMPIYPSDTCNYYVDDPKTNANTKFSFVSLGGKGGAIIVGMGGDIEEGDTLDVIELSDCQLANTNNSNGKGAVAEVEGMEVQVSTGSKIGSEWTFVMKGTVTKGVLTSTIPELAEVIDDGTDI